ERSGGVRRSDPRRSPRARGSMQDSARSAMQDAGVGGTAARAARAPSAAVLVAAVATLLSGAVPARAGGVAAPPGPATAPIPHSGAPVSSSGRLAATVRDRVPQIDPDHVVVRFRPGFDIAKHAARAGAHVSRQVDGTDWTELSTPHGSAGHARGVLAHD